MRNRICHTDELQSLARDTKKESIMDFRARYLRWMVCLGDWSTGTVLHLTPREILHADRRVEDDGITKVVDTEDNIVALLMSAKPAVSSQPFYSQELMKLGNGGGSLRVLLFGWTCIV